MKHERKEHLTLQAFFIPQGNMKKKNIRRCSHFSCCRAYRYSVIGVPTTSAR
uniref:Uncharacterized protein n=1 Tax=Picea sitchensis TaxID=3332 RepID=A9NT97_PICSI|nr:unknown [Picea sitchensis]